MLFYYRIRRGYRSLGSALLHKLWCFGFGWVRFGWIGFDKGIKRFDGLKMVSLWVSVENKVES